MSRLFLTIVGLALATLATGCCCGGGYGACRPNACASYAPMGGAPVASNGCSSCGY